MSNDGAGAKTDSEPGAEPRLRVSVTELEQISARGARKISWFVDDRGTWIAAHTWPAAEVVRAPAERGTVWQQQVQLLVPLGAELLRVERRPRDELVRDPLDYLIGKAPKLQIISRVRFRVGRGGRLFRLPAGA